MDLPTYTNIWRIEKRLYKLYDFRLPMPLPINWIAVFAGIMIPYVILLVAIGVPFNHTLIWLYVLPPGLLTWLTTRPVIEGKRLPELVESQVRYLTEPRTWVRLTPLSEKDRIVLTARVWRGRPARRPARPARPAPSARPVPAARPALPSAEPARASRPLHPGPVLRPTSIFRPEPAAKAAAQRQGGRRGQGSAAPQRSRSQERLRGQERSRSEERLRMPATGNGSARRAPALPAARSVQPVIPAVPPERADLPASLFNQPLRPSDPPGRHHQDENGSAHATPDVAPPATSVPAPPSPPAPGPGHATAPASPQDPVPPSWPAAPPRPARVVVPVPPGTTDPVPVPVPMRVRATGSGSSHLEVSHDGPGRRRPEVKPAAPDAPSGPVWPTQPLKSQPAAQAEQPAQSLAPARPAEPEQTDRPVQPAPPVWPAAAALAVSGPPVTVAASSVPPADPAHTSPLPARPLRPVPPTAEPAATAAGQSRPAESRPGEVRPAEAALAATAAAGKAADGEVRDAVAAAVRGTTSAAAPAATAAAIPAADTEVPAAIAEAVPDATPATAAAAAQPATAVPAKPGAPPAAAPATAVPETPAGTAAAAARVVTPAEAPAPSPARAAPVPAPVAPAPAASVHEVADPRKHALPSIERALSGPGRDMNASWHGKVRVVTGNGATHGPGARDQEAQDRSRARLFLSQPRRILILGCTSGAGQSVTALLTASMLASLREHPVAAVDMHDGTLARYRAPAATLEELLAGRPPQTIRQARPDGLHPTPKPTPSRLDVIASHEPLQEGDEIKLAVQLNRHYPLTVLDPGPSFLTRLLKVTDQLVVVVPANAEAAGALADTRDWLDNNGHAELAMQSVTVINGVSRRSLPDVEHAESIARGRSRAIVRIPWDDMLPVAAAGPSTLRPQTRVAYTALAGVLVAGLAAVPVRKKQ